MILAELYDAGSLPVHPASTTPGMDEAYYRDVRLEADIRTLTDVQNRSAPELRRVEPFTMRPWPELMPGKQWVDLCDRYAALGTDGLSLELYHWDELAWARELDPSLWVYPDATVAPAGVSPMLLEPDPEGTPEEGRITAMLGPEEIQERAAVPTDWIRLPTRNESGGADVGRPLLARWGGLRGNAFRLVVPDQSLFAPVDTRKGLNWYDAVDDDGAVLSDDLAGGFLDLLQRGRYALYLRPRRWRWVVTVVAHYLFITPFEVIPNDEVFLRAYYDAPPRYPYRHDLIHTTQTADLEDFYGNAMSYDPAIDYAFCHSSAAGELTREIVGQQYTSYCLSYVLTGVESPSIVLWRYPPEVGDVVLGIGVQDDGGREERIWWLQSSDEGLAASYPPTVIGQYLPPSYSVLW